MKYITRQEAVRFQHQATGTERLAALAAFLEALPPDRLTLGFWFKDGRGCAVGLAAATEPWFQAQGLRLKDIDRPALCHPFYQEMSDWDAVTAFFDLSFEHCRELFSAGAYNDGLQPPPGLIARRIRLYLAADATAETSGEEQDSSEVMHEAVIS
jgi:hypothetical protein